MFLQYAGHKFGLTDFGKKKKKTLRSGSVRAVWDKLALEALVQVKRSKGTQSCPGNNSHLWEGLKCIPAIPMGTPVDFSHCVEKMFPQKNL